MKKIMISFSCLALLLTAGAQAAVNLKGCNYTDTMNVTGPAGTHVISVTSDNQIGVQITKPTQFTIFDNGTCTDKDHSIVATIGTDNNNKSILKITDGATVWDPYFSYQNFGNFKYVTMEHRLLTFVYTLVFSSK